MANQGKGGVSTEIDIVRYIVKDLIESYAKERLGWYSLKRAVRKSQGLTRSRYMSRRRASSSYT